MFKKILLLTLLTITFSWSFSFAEGPLKICVSQMAPNVIKDGNSYSGFDIELWEAIGKDIGFESQYEEVEFKNMFSLLNSRKFDVGIAGSTVTSDREELVDFSHHYLDSGLRILVPNNSENNTIRTVKSIFTPSVLKCILYLIMFIGICGHILWIAEKGKDAINDNYIPGIFDAFWCVIATMTTVGYGDIAPKKYIGRLAAFMVMLVGISFFGFIVSQMTSTLTTQKFLSNISCPEDLRGKIVATKSGTTSEQILEAIGAKIITFENIDKAYIALIDGKAQAVVFDSPSIMYFAEHDGKGKVLAVEQVFNKQYYGFPINSENDNLRERINKSLLKLREDGGPSGMSTYDKIYNKWFN